MAVNDIEVLTHTEVVALLGQPETGLGASGLG
jgi:hypothetical protein